MKVSSVIKLLVSCGTTAFSLAEQRPMPTSINEICQKQGPLSNASICKYPNSSHTVNSDALIGKDVSDNTRRHMNTECKEDRWGNADMEPGCLVANFSPNYVDIIPPDSNNLKKLTVQANPNEKVDATLEIKSEAPFLGTFMMMCHSFFLYKGNDFIRGKAIGFSIQSGSVNAITTAQAIIIPIQEEFRFCPKQTYLLSNDQIIQSSDVEMSKNLSQNLLLGIKLDDKGNAKISFDTKEKKNESNSFNWENFCPTKDVGIYTTGNESSYDAKFTLNVSIECKPSDSNETNNKTFNTANVIVSSSVDPNGSKNETNGQLVNNKTMVELANEDNNLIYFYMAMIGGAIISSIMVGLRCMLRKSCTKQSLIMDKDKGTTRCQPDNVTIFYGGDDEELFGTTQMVTIKYWEGKDLA